MRKPKLLPEIRNLTQRFYDAIDKLGFMAKDPKASAEIFHLATEQLLARQRIQTYQDLIGLIKSHCGSLSGMEQVERTLTSMIRNEKELYKLDDNLVEIHCTKPCTMTLPKPEAGKSVTIRNIGDPHITIVHGSDP